MEERGFSIGNAAERTGLSVKTIRYYEEIGLIPKARRHDGSTHTGGNRVYSEIDIGRLRFIHHARLIDLGLDDIRELLGIVDADGCPGDQPEFQRILERHRADIDGRITHLLGLRKKIEGMMSRERSPEREACSWNTCDCMQPDAVVLSPREK